jgi:hypothetical protein
MVYKGDLKLMGILLKSAKSPVVNERRTATEILKELGVHTDNEAVELFAERYRSERNEQIRCLYLEIIQASRHPRKAEMLVETGLMDPDTGLRDKAWRELKHQFKDIPLDIRFDAAGDAGERAEAVAQMRRWVNLRKERRGHS